MIRIKKLTKSFGSKNVLKGINLEFEPGKVYGIVGENGAGKTTLFNTIAGLESFSGLIESNFTSLKNHLGFLQTTPFFFSKITGKEYLQLHCNARDIKKINFKETNIFDLPLNEYAINYSTGMKKKLALTAILIQQSDVFILDEPYNGVDIHSNLIITSIIEKLKSLNKTILISSHIFSTLKDTCDEIHFLKEGIIYGSYNRSQFKDLEKEMTQFTLGNIVDRLNLK
ncbi:MAG: ATP-binding cassette domain-containing protein [Crocinitomicaceae bacterium]|nr:ATP-binding cassette domain-containing protein [Crocinitomicaceae bacterium]